ncbi:hypothetical protein DP113_24410 [Brasilonema octagenarum UFV-E1]|uniref:Uncharacterized protein n=2 Tax=Brasilonema TaxID=383614 RepID=A0A856MNV9_9CYAN|nr:MULTISPECIES: hypothetical protein [Brasilonema]NMF66579.1 hypothetical protein [Brasilonema octagenarum UFV-OR1]QDL10636.1 hypothetical protein DP114_24495 [Brasilonema sennae CENA114]QDL16983.1 hypothetical protein DP113_24410 [Brasilonema octagenarum UFV-E1]
MKNKLSGLISTFVLITTVSIPQITFAGDRQPQTSPQLSDKTLTILEKNGLNDDQRQKITEEIQASWHELCLDDGQIPRSSDKDDFCNSMPQRVLKVHHSFHSKGNITTKMIKSHPVRIIKSKSGKLIVVIYNYKINLPNLQGNEILKSVEKEIPKVIQKAVLVIEKEIPKVIEKEIPKVIRKI